MTMIYAIFACIVINSPTGQGNCQPLPGNEIFATAEACKAEMRKSFGPGLYVGGELIPDSSRTKGHRGNNRKPLSYDTWSGMWYECMGKPTWSEAQ